MSVTGDIVRAKEDDLFARGLAHQVWLADAYRIVREGARDERRSDFELRRATQFVALVHLALVVRVVRVAGGIDLLRRLAHHD